MPAEMTSRQRLTAVFEHRTPDRVPIMDSPWDATVQRWRAEGLPEGLSPGDYFGYDKTFSIRGDNGPRYPEQVLEETDDYVIRTTSWGMTVKNWKRHGGVPEFLDVTVRDRDTWADAKRRMVAAEDRIDWRRLAEGYPRAVAEGAFLIGRGWFGYDVTSSWFVGTERVLMAMALEPDWCREMFEHELAVNLTLLELAWDRGYRFDAMEFPDDLGYRNGPLFSPATYRAVCQPVHARAARWCHDRGVKLLMHSCGNVMKLVSDLLEAGIDGLNPLEQKAGMDALALKRDFGDRLVLMGGVDVRKWAEGGRALEDETVSKIEALKRGSGYIFHSDHSVPENVSFADYCRVIELARLHGRYD